MKFTDGYWRIRAGVRPSYAAEAYKIEAGKDSLRVLATTRRIRHRGDMLEGPVLNVRLSSPLPDVIRVRVSHFEGGDDPGPHYPLMAEKAKGVQVKVDDSAATLTSGKLSARVGRGDDWGISFEAEGKTITKSPPRGMGYVRVGPYDDLADIQGDPFMHEQLHLGVGENVYGLGERFSAFVKNGQVVDIWNKDGGTSSEQSYKNVPFYLTNRGYGVFVNHSGEVSFEVASEKLSRVQFSVPGESLEYFVIYGPTPKEVLEKYTALTGRPALPPAWSFGLWLTTSFTTSYDEKTVTEFIQGMADRDIPLHTFHFDCFWMRGFSWTDLEWDPAVFPDPKGMLTRLKKRGLRICVWINSYIAQESKLFKEGKEGGYLLKRPNGDVWQWDMWQPGMGIVDFTNPAACKWYGDKLRALVDMGVDSFKTDFGERIPTEVAYFDGSDPTRMHNFYPYSYNKNVFDVLREKRGEGDAIVFARSATAGCQQFPVHWGGDCYSDFESMAESLRGGLSLTLSGFGFWSHDIGGFEGLPPAAIYKRWIAFGLLSSHSRLHGSTSYRVPWLYDEEACDVLRHFTKLKCRLMPYLFSKAVEAHETGVPVMRAMILEFPDNPACDYLDRQYMLGDSLLVAPVFSEDVANYYLPPGKWTEYMTGRTLEGPGWIEEKLGFMSMPLLVRPGSILPVGAQDSRPDYDYAKGVAFEVYEFADGDKASVKTPDTSGKTVFTLTASRKGSRISFEVEGSAEGWSVLLVNVAQAQSTEGCAAKTSRRGLTLTPQKGAKRFHVAL